MTNRILTFSLTLLVSTSSVLAEPTGRDASRIEVGALPDAIAWDDVERMPLLERPFGFSFDLDLLAPPGSGEGNFAAWFQGELTRIDEAARQAKVVQSKSGRSVRLLPDGLVNEAAGKTAIARCSFYPEVFEVRGFETRLPNHSLLLDLARNWAYRAEQNPQRAKELGESAVRLGRLLLQDEVGVVQHFAGVACIRIGAEILYDHGRRTGDGALTTLAQRAIGDAWAQKRVFESWMDESGGKIWESLRADSLLEHLFGPDVEISDAQADRIVSMFSSKAHPVLRAESSIHVALLMAGGSDAQKEKARETFQKVAADPKDPLSAYAKWWLENPIDLERDMTQMGVIE